MIRGAHNFLLVGVLIGAGAASSMVGNAQATPTASSDVLSALLIEVRGLRTAIEQMASGTPRVQLALGRLQIQEQRVAEVVRRLDTARASLRELQMRAELEQQPWTMMMQEGLNQQPPADPNERKAMEEMMKQMKANRQVMAGEIQRLQTEEAALSQDLANEQGRWSQLNQQLDELERSLTRRPQ